MSVESVPRKAKAGDLTIEAVLFALKHALKGKFEQDKINEAIGELANEKSWFETKKAELKCPEDLLKLEWTGVLFSAGLPLTEEEVKSVMTTAVQSIKPQASSIPEDPLEPSGSALDLVGDEDLIKAVEELKGADDDTLSDDIAQERTASDDLASKVGSEQSQHIHK